MSTLAAVLETGIRALEAELQRSEWLRGRAEKYLGAVALVTGFGTIRIGDFFVAASHPHSSLGIWPLGSSFFALALSFVLAVLALRTRGYWSFPDGESLVGGLDASEEPEKISNKLFDMYFTLQRSPELTRLCSAKWTHQIGCSIPQ